MEHVDKLPFPHLLNELKSYSPPHVTDKAMRVYRKCLLAGKHAIAARIRHKYPLSRHDRLYDLTDAVGISLMAMESKNPGKTV